MLRTRSEPGADTGTVTSSLASSARSEALRCRVAVRRETVTPWGSACSTAHASSCSLSTIRTSEVELKAPGAALKLIPLNSPSSCSAASGRACTVRSAGASPPVVGPQPARKARLIIEQS